jgi:hypothetical protein
MISVRANVTHCNVSAKTMNARGSELKRGKDEMMTITRMRVQTCEDCGLSYYPTTAPHVCAPWTGVGKVKTKQRSGSDECAFVHALPSGNVRCGALREHHSQYTGHEFTEPTNTPTPAREEWREDGDAGAHCSHSGREWTLSETNPSDVKCGYDYIASATTRKHATQIVADHRLAGLVPGLVETLDLVQRLLASQTTCEQSLCAACNDTRQTVLETVAEVLNAAQRHSDNP